jgi:hypothetical protein
MEADQLEQIGLETIVLALQQQLPLLPEAWPSRQRCYCRDCTDNHGSTLNGITTS